MIVLLTSLKYSVTTTVLNGLCNEFTVNFCKTGMF